MTEKAERKGKVIVATPEEAKELAEKLDGYMKLVNVHSPHEPQKIGLGDVIGKDGNAKKVGLSVSSEDGNLKEFVVGVKKKKERATNHAESRDTHPSGE